MATLKNILIGLATSVIIALLTWVAINTKDVPYLKEDLREQSLRHDALIQQEMDKREKMEKKITDLEKQVLILEIKLQK
jgi:hypothetical protein